VTGGGVEDGADAGAGAVVAAGAAGAALAGAAPEAGVPGSPTASEARRIRASVSTVMRAMIPEGPCPSRGAAVPPFRRRYRRNGFSTRIVWPRSAPTDTPMTLTPTRSWTRFTYARAGAGRSSQVRSWSSFSLQPGSSS